MSARDLVPNPFDFEGHPVRVVEMGGELQFHAGDVCEALGFANSRQALETHVEGDDVQKLDAIDSMGRTQQANHINEPGLYALTMGATKGVAKRFKHWVTHDVLPSIRKTGGYTMPTRTLTPAEMFLQNAQMMVDLEQRQLAQDEKIGRVEQRVEEIADTQLLTECPSNAESITTIRARINQKYGLPSRVIDQVVAQMPYSPKPAGTVLNGHESAKGSKYRIYWIRDISMIFERFVGESERTTPHRARHSFVEHEFKLAPGYGRDG